MIYKNISSVEVVSNVSDYLETKIFFIFWGDPCFVETEYCTLGKLILMILISYNGNDEKSGSILLNDFRNGTIKNYLILRKKKNIEYKHMLQLHVKNVLYHIPNYLNPIWIANTKASRFHFIRLLLKIFWNFISWLIF